MTIHLGMLLPTHSSSQPGSLGGSTRVEPRETPIWLCSWRGLPCPRSCPQGGGLLLHRFTLTPTRRAVCFLWRYPSGYPGRALPGTVVSWSPDFPPGLTLRPDQSGHPALRASAVLGPPRVCVKDQLSSPSGLDGTRRANRSVTSAGNWRARPDIIA